MATTQDGITTINVTGAELEDSVAKKHEHSNETTLNKLSENNGKLLFDGSAISGGSGDLSDYQKKTDNTLTTTDKTIVGAINEVKDSVTTNYVDLTNKPSINGVELDGNKSLSDLGITNYDDTQVKADISTNKSDIASLKEYKQNKTDNTLDTTDKTITGAINEVNGNLLDTVGLSADYRILFLIEKMDLILILSL